MSIKTKLEDLAIGDTIICRYKAGGLFSELGTCVAPELPLAASASPDGSFYFRKVDTGMLIADRVVQHSISWDTLNSLKLIQGTRVALKPLIPIYTAPSPDIVASSTDGNDPRWAAYSIFNGDVDDYGWLSGQGDATPSVVIHLGSSKKIYAYDLNPKPSNTYACGTCWTSGWKIYLSDEDVPTNWILVDTQIGKSECIKYRTELPIPMNAKHIKIEVTSKTTISYWYTLNSFQAYGEFNLIRSLTGGNAYLGTDGKASLTDKGLGAFPANNEWDKYIVKSNLGGTITAGDDNVWHWKSTVTTWCQDTTNIGIVPSTSRVCRSPYLFNSVLYGSDNKYFTYGGSSGTSSSQGFRPVLEYIEPKSKAANLFY